MILLCSKIISNSANSYQIDYITSFIKHSNGIWIVNSISYDILLLFTIQIPLELRMILEKIVFLQLDNTNCTNYTF